jgi:myo-inositol-1(or 4)-monophosphatase
MDPEVLEKARQVAVEAALKAGGILKENFGKSYWVKEKDGQETLTEIDLKADKAIKEIIQKVFPGHSILTEESGQEKRDTEWLWVVDPLDGTTNYSINNPFFCTSISLAFGKEAVVAVTHAPMTGEMFSAVKGQGAFLNGKPIQVSGEGDVGNLLLSFCNGKEAGDKVEIARIFAEIKPLAKDFDRYKAGALELAFVSAGRFGSYMANNQMSWDSAAGALLVREAGGKVTDFEGRPWDIESKDILATNGKIHGMVLEILKKVRSSK